jgi:hypothetical protein
MRERCCLIWVKQGKQPRAAHSLGHDERYVVTCRLIGVGRSSSRRAAICVLRTMRSGKTERDMHLLA